jgi:hypothetical protein
MPFANFRYPKVQGFVAQKGEIIHKTTNVFGQEARNDSTFLADELSDADGAETTTSKTTTPIWLQQRMHPNVQCCRVIIRFIT